MMESASAFQDRVDSQSQSSRVVYQFNVPEELCSEDVAKTIGLVKVNGREEKTASKKARGDNTMLAYELVKLSLYEVDGRRLKRAEHEAERIFNAMDPKLRNLVMAAYAKLHSPEDDETENFLGTMKEKVG